MVILWQYTDMSEQYLTVDQAAERLQVHPRTVRRLLVSGELPGNRIGRQWRISPSALQSYVEGGARKPPTSAGPGSGAGQKTGSEGD